MRTLTFQQESTMGGSRPWPVLVEFDGKFTATVVHGRPDALALIGFQQGAEQHVKVYAGDVTDGSDIIGLNPVYSDGVKLFAVLLPVASATVQERIDE